MNNVQANPNRINGHDICGMVGSVIGSIIGTPPMMAYSALCIVISVVAFPILCLRSYHAENKATTLINKQVNLCQGQAGIFGPHGFSAGQNYLLKINSGFDANTEDERIRNIEWLNYEYRIKTEQDKIGFYIPTFWNKDIFLGLIPIVGIHLIVHRILNRHHRYSCQQCSLNGHSVNHHQHPWDPSEWRIAIQYHLNRLSAR